MARSNTPQLIAGVLVLFGIIHYFRGRDLSANADNAEETYQDNNQPPLLDGSNGGGGNESGQDTPAPSPQNYDITYNTTYNGTQGRPNPRAAEPAPAPAPAGKTQNTFGGIPVPTNYSSAQDYFSQLRNSLANNNYRIEPRTKFTSSRGSSRSSSRNSFNLSLETHLIMTIPDPTFLTAEIPQYQKNAAGRYWG